MIKTYRIPLTFALSAITLATSAQEFRIQSVNRDSSGRPQISFTSSSAAYYILYRGENITNIRQPVGMILGTNGTVQVKDSSQSAVSQTVFYRIERVLLNQPRDTDSDGIDDLVELNYPLFLNPLDPADAALDFDGDGKSNLAEYRSGTDLSTKPPTENRPPVVTMSAPVVDAVITAPTDIVGRITDESVISYYQIDAARSDQVTATSVTGDGPEWISFGKVRLGGSSKDFQGVLGKFDPTILANGEYLIRLRASDGANVTNVTLRVQLGGQYKVGYVRLAFTDLTIPLAGIPITIRRVYDSRQAGDRGDFGFGWSLDQVAGNVLETKKKTSVGLFGDPETTMTKDTRVYLTLPDGRRVGFSFAPEFASRNLLLGDLYRPVFKPDPGVFHKLELLNQSQAVQQIVIKSDGSVGLPLFTFFGFDPSDYRLTAPDGTVYEYNDTDGLRKVVDPAGNTLTFTKTLISHSSGQAVQLRRDSQGRITEILGRDGYSVRYAYDARGDLASVTDPGGDASRLTYLGSPAHMLTRITDSFDGIVASADYDSQGRLVSFRDATGRSFQESFDPGKNVGTYTDGNGNITLQYYDDRGNLIQTADPMGATNRFVYDASNRLIESVNSRGFSSKRTYDERGNVTSLTDALGKVTRFEHTTRNKLAKVTDTMGSSTGISYDRNGYITNIVNTLGNSAVLDRDAEGHIVRLVDFRGHATRYDHTNGCSCGLPGKVINPDGSSRTYDYNRFGQIIRQMDERSGVTILDYDGAGRLLAVRDPAGARMGYGYTGDIRTSETNGLGRVRRVEYNEAKRPVTEIDAAGGIARATYDGNGNRTSITDPVGNITRFVYDKVNRLVEEIDPLGKTVRHRYNSEGNRIETVDRNGHRRTFEYDSRNLWSAEHWWEGDTRVRTIQFAYDELGRLSRISDPSAAYEYEYDALGHVTAVRTSGVANMPDWMLRYVYDSNGNVVSIAEYPGVADTVASPPLIEVRSEYDSRNRLIRRTWQGSVKARVDFGYDSIGNRTNLTRYADIVGAPISGSSRYDRNAVGAVTNILHLGPTGNLLLSLAYTRGQAQQINRRVITSMLPLPGAPVSTPGQPSQVQATEYTHDLIGQLIRATYSDRIEEAFPYDSNGNRIAPGYAVGTGNQMLASPGFGYAYDAEGNLTVRTNLATRSQTRYLWDHRNRLTSILDYDATGRRSQQVEFSYDALDRRIVKRVNGQAQHFRHDRDDIWSDFDSGGNFTNRYLVGASIDELLATANTATGALDWFLADNLGSKAGISDKAGVFRNATFSSAFGQTQDGLNPIEPSGRMFFTGREWDRDAGLFFMRSRYYDPLTGRFLSQDPVRYTHPELNPYRYVFNQPLRYVDPFGHQALIEYALLLTVCNFSFAVLEDKLGQELISEILKTPFGKYPFLKPIDTAFAAFQCASSYIGLVFQAVLTLYDNLLALRVIEWVIFEDGSEL